MTCSACGTYGHDAKKNCCDLMAQVLMVTRYIKKEPKGLKIILQKYQDHQDTRKCNLLNKSFLSERLQHKANNRQLKFSPQLRALFDVLGDAMEDIFDEECGVIQNLEDKLDDSFDISTYLEVVEDESTTSDYHDSQ